MMRYLLEETLVEMNPEEAVEEIQHKSNIFIEWAKGQIPNVINFAITAVIALIIFFVGKKLIHLILNVIHKNFERARVEEGVTKFLISLFRVLLYFILLIVVAQILGLESSSIIAVLGSAGLAVGLALQGSLANIAGGVLILIFKPFVMGDYIVYGDKEGTVVGIDIIYTRLLTPDNRKITLPNGSLANADIINVTSEEKRRVDLFVAVDYSEDIKKVKGILEGIANKSSYVIQSEEKTFFVNSFEASAINIGLRVWVKTEDYWEGRWAILEEIKEEFDKNNIVIPFDQLDVKIKSE